ncbi:MAG TPA: hypothetical protein VKB39_05625, partial [Candidatus Baltobacteraceae bacterium]|nr:hypothetical protein [Candidatus Baltobacteraceae bacterium]
TVRVTGRGPGGAAFDKGWSFTVRNGAPAMHLTINQPSGDTVNTTFTIQGNTVANGRIAVTVGVPPSSSGMLSRNTTAGQYGNFSMNVTITRNPGQQSIKIRIVATDPATGRTQEQILQFRLR